MLGGWLLYVEQFQFRDKKLSKILAPFVFCRQQFWCFWFFFFILILLFIYLFIQRLFFFGLFWDSSFIWERFSSYLFFFDFFPFSILVSSPHYLALRSGGEGWTREKNSKRKGYVVGSKSIAKLFLNKMKSDEEHLIQLWYD